MIFRVVTKDFEAILQGSWLVALKMMTLLVEVVDPFKQLKLSLISSQPHYLVIFLIVIATTIASFNIILNY